jgi:hypothetical protein
MIGAEQKGWIDKVLDILDVLLFVIGEFAGLDGFDL